MAETTWPGSVEDLFGKDDGSSFNSEGEKNPKNDENNGSPIRCPVCGSEMVKFSWGYRCSGFQNGCYFSIGTIAGKKLSEKVVRTLCEEGKTDVLTGFVSKRTGKKFSAALKLEKKIDEAGNETKQIVLEFPDPETLNIHCPLCGKHLIKYGWGYGCEGKADGCPFHIGEIAGVMLPEAEVRRLASSGKTGIINGFVSKKTGIKYSASLRLEVDDAAGGKNVKIVFDFPDDEKSEADSHADLHAVCPECGSPMKKGKHGWECSAGCGVRVPYKLCSRKISTDEAEELLSGGATQYLNGFISKKGKPFSAALQLNGKKVEFIFDE